MQTSDIQRMAVRVASTSVTAAGRRKKAAPRRRKKAAPRRDVADRLETVSVDILEEAPEISCRIELDISASFEGTVAKANLVRKLKSSLLSAVKAGVTDVARSLNLKSGGVSVRPIRLECDVVDV